MHSLIKNLSTRQLEFPAQLIVQKGAATNSKYFIEQLGNKKVLFALDDGVRNLADQPLSFIENDRCTIHAITRADFDNISQIDMICAQQQIQTVIAFGGGKVLDVCKRLATIRKVDLIVIPTALSSDCISSPVAVITDKDGKKLSLPAAIPTSIIVDTEICVQAPLRLTQAGVGDLLSNYSALLDMEYAKEQIDFDGFSFLLAKSAANEILYLTDKPLNSLPVINQLAEGLILSGLAMGFSGDSRPCSGAEHLISHAIDYLQLGHGLHGEQVAMATKFCHYLRKLLSLPTIPTQALNAIDAFGINSSPAMLGMNKQTFFKALALAPQMRKGRITFLDSLDTISTARLETAYRLAFDN